VSAGAPPLPDDALEPVGERTAEILAGTDPLIVAVLHLASAPGCPARGRLTREFGGAAHLDASLECLTAAGAATVDGGRIAASEAGRTLLRRILTPAGGETEAPDLALERLLDEARAGSRESLSRLLHRGSEEARKIAHHRIGPALRAKLETVDIAQSVMGELIAGLDRFEYRGEAAWRGYLRRLVENKIRAKADYYGAARRDARREVGLPDAHGGLDPAPEDALMRAEDLDRLEEAMESMRPDEREVIFLRVFEGLTHREVAKRMGRPSEAAVHKLYGRALTRLTGLLGRDA
jgi:RNA polymerase sigma-70 factor (ECF subfamily)